jgi:hypothetical protein
VPPLDLPAGLLLAMGSLTVLIASLRARSCRRPEAAPGRRQRDGQLIRYSPRSTNPAMSLAWVLNRKMAARW